VVSKAELDAAESKFKQKEGVVNNMRSMISKKEVLAPFDGQLGIRQVNVGQMVTAGQQVVSLQALDPLYVDFALPQQYLSKLSPGLEVRVHTDVVAGREFTGKLTALNSSVDPVTRNVTLQATIENKDRVLRPGMFARIQVDLGVRTNSVMVPERAVTELQGKNFVWLVGTDDKATQKPVRVGETIGQDILILEGVKAGDRIITEGLQKVREGVPVQPKTGVEMAQAAADETARQAAATSAKEGESKHGKE
jgi:membrane fusion protein (multidrug efflux system)